MYNIQELTLTYNKLAQVKKEMQLKIHIKINLNLHYFGEGQAHGQCAIYSVLEYSTCPPSVNCE